MKFWGRSARGWAESQLHYFVLKTLVMAAIAMTSRPRGTEKNEPRNARMVREMSQLRPMPKRTHPDGGPPDPPVQPGINVHMP
ncbi:hypothetical protein D9M69_678400 [compost metagenome]